MLLEKIYQPDIAVYQEGVLGPMFMVEVVEAASLSAEAEATFVPFMARHLCFRGAVVNQGRMRVLDVFPSSNPDMPDVSTVAEIDLERELRQFSGKSGQVWSSERNFFEWLKSFLLNDSATSLSQSDLDAFRREVLPWTKDWIVEFTSLRGKSFGQAY